MFPALIDTFVKVFNGNRSNKRKRIICIGHPSSVYLDTYKALIYEIVPFKTWNFYIYAYSDTDLPMIMKKTFSYCDLRILQEGLISWATKGQQTVQILFTTNKYH